MPDLIVIWLAAPLFLASIACFCAVVVYYVRAKVALAEALEAQAETRRVHAVAEGQTRRALDVLARAEEHVV